MIKRKKKIHKKNFSYIGEKRYGFNLDLEKTIYDYLCCFREKEKKSSQLDNKLKFNSYKQWEKYIQDKYSVYDNETLIEFSRYLNHMIRDNEAISKYWELCIPVILTVILTKWIDGVLEATIGFTVIALVVLLIFFIWHTVSPMFNEYWDGCMLKDYKEIIDNMIEK